MILLALIAVVVVAVVLSAARRRDGAPPGDRTAAQGPPPKVPLVAEALGYLGGVLAVVGVVLLVSRYWPDLALGWQLALSGGTAAVLIGAGAASPEDREPALARLRWSLWTLGTAAVVVAAWAAARTGAGWGPPGVAAAGAAAATVTGAVLWAGRARPLQHLVTTAGVVVTAGTLVNLVAPVRVVGLSVWAVSAAVFTLGALRRGGLPLVELLVGSVGAVAGAIMVAVGGADVDAAAAGLGWLLATLTAVGLLAVVFHPRVLTHPADIAVVAVVGGVGLAQVLPSTIGYYAAGAALPTAAVLWSAGAGLLLLAALAPVRAAPVVESAGAVTVLVACAVSAAATPSVATVAGLATSVALVGLALLPHRVLLSLFGAAGLLAYVPWTIVHWFPGEGRAPLLILVSGLLLIAVAALLARQAHRFGAELGRRPGGPSSR